MTDNQQHITRKHIIQIQRDIESINANTTNLSSVQQDVSKYLHSSRHMPEILKGKVLGLIKDKAKGIKNTAEHKDNQKNKQALINQILNYFDNCSVLHIGGTSKEQVLEALYCLKSQNTIMLSKHIPHNNCYFEFIVRNDTLIPHEHKHTMWFSEEKLTYKVISDFIRSLNKDLTQKVPLFNHKKRNTENFSQYLQLKEDIVKLKAQKSMLMFELAEQAEFSLEVRQYFSFSYAKHNSAAIFNHLSIQNNPLHHLIKNYEKVLDNRASEIENLKSITKNIDLDHSLEQELQNIYLEHRKELMEEYNKNKILLNIIFNSNIYKKLKLKEELLKLRIEEITKHYQVYKVKKKNDYKYFIKVLNENNIFNYSTKEYIFFIVSKNTDVNQLFLLPENKYLKGFCAKHTLT